MRQLCDNYTLQQLYDSYASAHLSPHTNTIQNVLIPMQTR